MFLIFAAGLLPDPDSSFHPSIPNFYTWVIALVFELSILAFRVANVASYLGEASSLEGAETALGTLRALLLVMMSVVFMSAGHRLHDMIESNSYERGSLISNRNPEPQQYGGTDGKAINKTNSVAADAQSSGWLDYFIGFRVLFPYIWYFNSDLVRGIG